jgi:hypothetical protein
MPRKTKENKGKVTPLSTIKEEASKAEKAFEEAREPRPNPVVEFSRFIKLRIWKLTKPQPREK